MAQRADAVAGDAGENRKIECPVSRSVNAVLQTTIPAVRFERLLSEHRARCIFWNRMSFIFGETGANQEAGSDTSKISQ